MLELREIGFSYGNLDKDRAIFKNINWVFEKNLNTAIIGPSGAGKSTLLRLISGLESPTHGDIILNGQIVSRSQSIVVPAHKRKVSMLFQDLGLWPWLNVEQTVALGKVRSTPAQILEALRICRARHLVKRQVSKLSGGEKQRVALARALIHQPKLLLLDEPFAGLDLEIRIAIIKELKELTRDLGITLILVAHDPWEARLMTESVLVLEDCQIKDSGSWGQVLEQPRSRFLGLVKNNFIL